MIAVGTNLLARFYYDDPGYSFSSVNAEIDCKIIYHNLYGK